MATSAVEDAWTTQCLVIGHIPQHVFTAILTLVMQNNIFHTRRVLRMVAIIKPVSCIQCGQIQMQAKSITLTYQVLGVTERGLTTLNKIQHIIAPELFQVNEILGHMDAT